MAMRPLDIVAQIFALLESRELGSGVATPEFETPDYR
jgi:hypothetical protein